MNHALEQFIRNTRLDTSWDVLTAIEALAVEEPKRIHMGIVLARGDMINLGYGEYRPACDTIGCIAGWSMVLTTDESLLPKRSGNETSVAQRILGLGDDQAMELFWPLHLMEARGDDDYQTPEHAAGVVKHIQAFKTKYEGQLKAHKIVRRD